MTYALIAEGGRHFGRMHDRGFYLLLELLFLVALGAAIGVAVWFVARRRPTAVSPLAPTPAAVSPLATSPTAAAEAILAERLARGEISPDDYRTHLAALRGDAPSA